jgi:hypothetical protein
MLEQDAQGVAAEGVCPFLWQTPSLWLNGVPSYCTGVSKGLMMVLTVHEHQALCGTAKHTTCLIYQGRRGEDHRRPDPLGSMHIRA